MSNRSIRSTLRRRARLLAVAVLTAALCTAPALHAATLTVTTLTDAIASDGQCSLREALLNAQNNNVDHADCAAGSGMDLVTFDPGLFSGTPSTATLQLDATLGTLQVLGDGLQLAAPAGHRLVLRGDHSFRLLRASMFDQQFILSDVDLEAGHAASGGALDLGALALARFERVRFIDNTADSAGGAVHVINSVAFGPIVFECIDSRFDNNRVPFGQGGAVYVSTDQPSTFEFSGCVFNGNQAVSGGAIFFSVGTLIAPAIAQLQIESSVFENNRATEGAALRAQPFNSGARLWASISDSRFSANRALSFGAGLLLRGRADDPKGNVRYRLERNSFLQNLAQAESVSTAEAGAVVLQDADATLVNNLFFRNVAQGPGAGVLLEYGQLQADRELHLIGNSFYENRTLLAFNGPTLLVRPPAGNAALSLQLTGNLFAVDPLHGEDDCSIDPSGPGFALLGGYNLSDRDCATGAGSQNVEEVGVAPAPLAQPVHTLSLLPQPFSPALDFWPTVACLDPESAPLTGDLLGAARPANGDGSGATSCDAGAFERPAAALIDVVLSGNGSGHVVTQPEGIDCPDRCSFPFPLGTQVTLTASADPGSVFVGWDDVCTGTGVCVLQAGESTEAVFALAPTRALSVVLDGDGEGSFASDPSGIACPPQCSANFAENGEVTLTPIAGPDSEFDGYAGGGCSGTGPCTLTMDMDRIVPASFSATAFALQVARSGSGNGRLTSVPAGIDCPGDCAEVFPRSELVALSAQAASGSVFVEWSGACSGSGACLVDMDAGPAAVGARFEALRTLTVATTGAGSGQVSSTPAGIACPGDCGQSYPSGASVTLTAMPAPGSAFFGWGGSACTGGNPCLLTMDADRSVTADFALTSNELQVDIVGSGRIVSSPPGIDCPGDCGEAYAFGTEVALTPTPAPGFVFLSWQGHCVGSGACVLPLTGARDVTAHFAAGPIFADGFE